jgi:hypothetical protein
VLSTRWPHDPNSAASRVANRPELWGLIAEHSGLVGAWRLTGVCTAARVGAKDWLRTLPGMVVCGGYITGGGDKSEVWRLDLGELRWERMSDLGGVRYGHACCAVRGGVVVLGGLNSEEGVLAILATVEVLKAGELTFTALPPLSCGPRSGSTALPIDESESAEGEVLLLGGYDAGVSVVKVDLATGACTPLPPLLHERRYFSAARLPDGRVVCAGGYNQASITADILEPPEHGSADCAWQ